MRFLFLLQCLYWQAFAAMDSLHRAREGLRFLFCVVRSDRVCQEVAAGSYQPLRGSNVLRRQQPGIILINKSYKSCGMPSSVVAAIKYDANTSTLRVIYISGSVYDYKDVPEKVYKEMKEAFSKGEFLNKHIKPNYEFEKIR